MQQEIYYKVVKVVHGELTSAIVPKTSFGAVRYRLGKATRPRKGCGPLCVFETLESAILFFGPYDRPNTRIYACQIERSRAKKVWNGEGYAGVFWLTAGTVLAQWVKLSRLVDHAAAAAA